MDGRRLQNRHNPPQIGEHTDTVLTEIGMTPNEIAALQATGTIAIAPAPA